MKLFKNDRGWWQIEHTIPLNQVEKYIEDHYTRLYITANNLTVLADYHEGMVLAYAMNFANYFGKELELE